MIEAEGPSKTGGPGVSLCDSIIVAAGIPSDDTIARHASLHRQLQHAAASASWTPCMHAIIPVLRSWYHGRQAKSQDARSKAFRQAVQDIRLGKV